MWFSVCGQIDNSLVQMEWIHMIEVYGMIMVSWKLRRSDNGVEEEWIFVTAIMDTYHIEDHFKTGFTNKVGWMADERINPFL